MLVDEELPIEFDPIAGFENVTGDETIVGDGEAATTTFVESRLMDVDECDEPEQDDDDDEDDDDDDDDEDDDDEDDEEDEHNDRAAMVTGVGQLLGVGVAVGEV